MFKVDVDPRNGKVRMEVAGRTIWLPINDGDRYTDFIEAWVNLAIADAMRDKGSEYQDLSER